MEQVEGQGVEIRGCGAGRGVDWIGAAFNLFKQDPGNWIGIFVIWLVISMALSMMFLDIASAFLNPIFSGGIMLACLSQARGERIRVGYLFEAFKGDRVGPLLLLVVLQIVIAIGIAVLAVVFAFLTLGDVLTTPEAALEPENSLRVLALVLLVVALFLPLAMMSWFAVPLIVLRRVGAWDAMLLSFRACLKNWLPFLLYGLLGLAIMLLAILPLLLGLIVAIPVMAISVFTSYREIFPEPEPVEPQAVSA